MPLAAHGSTLKVSGTATAVTDEPTTSLGGGVYQVTSTTRRAWEPSVAVVVADGGTPVSSTLWSFDYLYGRVTFNGYTPTGAVTVTGSYLPTYSVAEVTGFNFTFGPELLDRTSFDSGGVKQKLGGLLDGSGSVEFLSNPLDDVDTGAGGTQSLVTRHAAGTPMLLDVVFSSGLGFRAWIVLEGIEENAAAEGLVEGSAAFQLAPQRAGAVLAFKNS